MKNHKVLLFVGLGAAVLLYLYYRNQQANANTGTSSTNSAGTVTPDTSASGYSSLAGGLQSATAQEASDVNSLQNQLNSLASGLSSLTSGQQTGNGGSSTTATPPAATPPAPIDISLHFAQPGPSNSTGHHANTSGRRPKGTKTKASAAHQNAHSHPANGARGGNVGHGGGTVRIHNVKPRPRPKPKAGRRRG